MRPARTYPDPKHTAKIVSEKSKFRLLYIRIHWIWVETVGPDQPDFGYVGANYNAYHKKRSTIA